MKICFVLGHELPFPPLKGGGVNSLLMGLCEALANLGHSVTAYSPTVIGRPVTETINGIKHIRIKGTSRRSNNLLNVMSGIPYALRVLNVLEDCDVVSSHLWHGFFFSATKKAKVVTHTVHRDPKKYLYLFSLVDRIYSGSTTVTEDGKKIVPNLSKKLKTVFNCVDFSKYPPPVPRARDGNVNFIFVGRISKDKGLATFIPAFCEAALTNQNINFKAVGPITATDGGDESFVTEMQEYVRDKGLVNRVEFVPPVYERGALDAKIQDSDVVVLPSIGGETLNMSILESMRLGKALLISDLPANKPLVENEKNGLFATKGNVSDWTGKILDMASDINKLERFGLNSYNYGKEMFSCEMIALKYIEDFTNLIEGKNKWK